MTSVEDPRGTGGGLWQLYYCLDPDGGGRFAELMAQSGKLTLRTGELFTGGVVRPVDSLDSAQAMLEAQHFVLHSNWQFTPDQIDFGVFVAALRDAIEGDPLFAVSNALALVTDGDVMTLSLTFHHFDDLAAVDDGELWSPEEWGPFSGHWLGDPAYRWLVAYGYRSDPYGEQLDQFKPRLAAALVEALMPYRDSKPVLFISVSDGADGEEWSMPLMDAAMSNRMRGAGL